MEDKQTPSQRKLSPIREEKNNEKKKTTCDVPRAGKKYKNIDLEITQNKISPRKGLQKIIVSVKPRSPRIKTLYIAEKTRINSKKDSKRSSLLGIGDHSSFTTHVTACSDSTLISSATESTDFQFQKQNPYRRNQTRQPTSACVKTSASQCHEEDSSSLVTSKNIKEKCFSYTPHQSNIYYIKSSVKCDTDNSYGDVTTCKKGVDVSHEDIRQKNLTHIYKRIEHLEQRILRQEMVFQALEQKSSSSSTEESKNEAEDSRSNGRPGCSYVEQYSHVPETSAFYRRHGHVAAPLSSSKATTIEKEHNSEQYSRDFTTYDGITSRGRRQCASVPCKREEVLKIANDRGNKIRHKLNPVRDYRLMDTVHYLAQGEFAPRDDGIKLTPSREAVLSDIIWEDVFRTHWPNARLGRRGHPDRCSTRWELQRLIDSLLRERVAHVERRRRRHYRIVKLNQRHENCRPLGKTGDVIVAKHHDRQSSECDPQRVSSTVSRRRRHRSNDRADSPGAEGHHTRPDDCIAGTSYSSKTPTCCYHSVSPKMHSNAQKKDCQETASSGSTSTSKLPRLVAKKDSFRRKYHKEDSNLEHFILLPTLVVRTPSNVKRQKKFNELYHRILNVQQRTSAPSSNIADDESGQTTKKQGTKDIGLNFNINLLDSEEK